LMNTQHGHPVAATVANKSGVYAIQAPAGTYALCVFRSNYFARFETAPVVTLGSGATITTNLYLTNATASISGRLVDANNSNIVLPGILITAPSTNGMIAIGFTDTNGYYNIGVRAGQSSIKADDLSLIVHG